MACAERGRFLSTRTFDSRAPAFPSSTESRKINKTLSQLSLLWPIYFWPSITDINAAALCYSRTCLSNRGTETNVVLLKRKHMAAYETLSIYIFRTMCWNASQTKLCVPPGSSGIFFPVSALLFLAPNVWCKISASLDRQVTAMWRH